MSIKLGNDRDMSYTYRQSRDTIIRGNTLAGYKDIDIDYFTLSSPGEFTLEVYARSISPQSRWDDKVTLYYSTDKSTWSRWDGSPISAALRGDTYYLYLRGVGNKYLVIPQWTGGSGWAIAHFSLTGSNITVSGNIETLLDYQIVMRGEHPETSRGRDHSGSTSCGAFEELFKDCTSIVSVSPDLLSTTRSSPECYCEMFFGCTSLISVPRLPAEGISEYCCQGMFADCESLTTLPANMLPATRLAEGCYMDMFVGCTSLSNLPKLPATELPANCYSGMFEIELSTTQSEDYPNEYRIPFSGTGVDSTGSALTNMFINTNGEMFTPTINTTYYTNATVV